jgi:hypothetical protein
MIRKLQPPAGWFCFALHSGSTHGQQHTRFGPLSCALVKGLDEEEGTIADAAKAGVLLMRPSTVVLNIDPELPFGLKELHSAKLSFRFEI